MTKFLVLALVILVGSAGCAPALKVEPTTRGGSLTDYSIEQITPDILRVIALTSDYSYDDELGGLVSGYGKALSEGLKKISQKYEIVEIQPVAYHIGAGSATKELIVMVKVK